MVGLEIVLMVAAVLGPGPAKDARPRGVPAPEFPTLEASHWIGTPVRLEDLRGKVVLLDVWTFG
jgi:hypothetical protein